MLSTTITYVHSIRRSAVARGRRLFSDAPPPFRPRRRPSENYRPVQIKRPTIPGPRDPLTYDPIGREEVVLGEYAAARDPLERDFGPLVADMLRDRQRAKRLGGREITVDEYLQMADYMTSEPGSLEEKQGERRALALDLWDDEDRDNFMSTVDQLVEAARVADLGLGDDEHDDEDDEDDGKHKAYDDDDDDEDDDDEEQDDGKEDKPKHKKASEEDDDDDDDDDDDVDDFNIDGDGDAIDPARMVHGEWGEMVIRMDRVQKVQRGGTMVRYRALIVGGNTNGCAGFGIAKGNSPPEALVLASRKCKRNIFFVDRYKGSGLTTDLAGRHNSCKVILRAVDPHFGLHGHPLVSDILLYFGISDCTAKTFGNRNQYNVVRATFKALLTHESMEQIALKRGRRLMNLERVKRLQI